MRDSRLYILAISGLAGVFLWVGLAWGQSSGSFRMEKSTIDGGGGGMACGSFVLQGTTGQMEAGGALASSSGFRLAGGFWPQAALEPEETSTPDPDETPTPDPEETPTADPGETLTPDPGETSTPDPEETPTPDPNATPTPEGEGEEHPPSLFIPSVEG